MGYKTTRRTKCKSPSSPVHGVWVCHGIAIGSSKWKTNWQIREKISGHGKYECKWQNLAKPNKDIKCYTGKTDKTSENNKVVDKLASCLIKTRILKTSREQIQNKPIRMIDNTFGKLTVHTNTKTSGEMENQIKPGQPDENNYFKESKPRWWFTPLIPAHLGGRVRQIKNYSDLHLQTPCKRRTAIQRECPLWSKINTLKPWI